MTYISESIIKGYVLAVKCRDEFILGNVLHEFVFLRLEIISQLGLVD